MATILKSEERNYQENPNRVDNFKILTDVTRLKKGIDPQNLMFDLRQLNPGNYSSPYHFHRNAEELFFIISGTSTLRTPEGLEILCPGDLVFFEIGESGAHQLFNHSNSPCVYLDIRTFLGSDICEYPDSNKLLIAPSNEIFHKGKPAELFDGENLINEKWNYLINNHKD